MKATDEADIFVASGLEMLPEVGEPPSDFDY